MTYIIVKQEQPLFGMLVLLLQDIPRDVWRLACSVLPIDLRE